MNENIPFEPVSSVMKVFDVLQALVEQPESGVTELSQRLKLSKSTVYRFLQTMKMRGYVTQEGETDKYSLTLKLFELSSLALENIDLIRFADREMRLLSQSTHEAIHLGVRDQDGMVYVHKIEAQYSLRMHSKVGRRLPLYSTAIGKVLLAWRNEEEVRSIMEHTQFTPLTPHTLKNLDTLISELAEVPNLGFAKDEEEHEQGLHCIAVPIFDRFDRVCAGLSISVPLIRFEPDQQAKHLQLLHQAGAKISNQLGCHNYLPSL